VLTAQAYYECFNQAIRNYTDTLANVQEAKAKQVPVYSLTSNPCQELVMESINKADGHFKYNASAIYETYKNTLKHSFVVQMLGQMYVFKFMTFF
jgi:hypothetical protein